MFVAESRQHLLDGLAPASVGAAADGVGIEQYAIDEDRIEDLPDVVAAKPAALPVITSGDRPRLFPHVPGQRGPDEDEIEVARVVREENALTGVVNVLEEANGLPRDRPSDQDEQPGGGSAPKLPARPGSSTGSTGLRRSPQRGPRTDMCALTHSDALSLGCRPTTWRGEIC